MAWEQRRDRKYYYRARRVHGRVVKEYVGSGEKAQAAAAEDAARIEKRKDDFQQRCEAQLRLAALQQNLEPFWSITERLASLILTASDYHRHRGEWRRRHGHEKDA